MQQITNTILMVRPATFRANEETAVNNYYQKTPENTSEDTLLFKARNEFDAFVTVLRNKGIEVVVVEGDASVDTPDAHFPNNWISFHQDGRVAVYPMFAKNRRLERRDDVLDILEQNGFLITETIDYSSAEEEGYFLEGTGSIIMDRINKKAYCALSPRADEELFIEFCEDFDYAPVIFTALQNVGDQRLPIYHTNVMMCLGENFAVICLESIDDKKEQKNVVKHLKEDAKEVIAITEKQMQSFAGNMLQVIGSEGQKFLIMSSAAFRSLTPGQIQTIEKYCEIVHSSLEMIETCGGGSARCMMAEVFLPRAISN